MASPDHASHIHDPLADAIQRNLFTIETDERIDVYRASSGICAGSSIGITSFSLGVWPAMQPMTQQRSAVCASLLDAICPCDGQTYNGGHTVFADDLRLSFVLARWVRAPLFNGRY